jgi:ribonucleoside-diphosphate reductase alpha chain
MRGAKNCQWYIDEPQRQLANNSAAYTEKPELGVFLKEWSSLYVSKAGERGIFSRVAARKQVAKNGRRNPDFEWGCNPCSEILLRPNQFCNLTEVVVRTGDTEEDLLRKVRVATILGTLQSTVTKFRYLRKVWQRNTEEERLLGVSLTGVMDHQVMGDPDNPELGPLLNRMRDYAIEVNKEWADKLGIPQSAAICTNKPSGNVSQLNNTASGIHPRFSQYYIRRVRIDSKDPLGSFLRDAGVPCEVDCMNPSALVFSFPIKSPESARLVADVGAMKQLKLWMTYQEEWCEHKPSCTVYYTDDEFLKIGAWIWENFDKVSGISFLPKSDHIYQQAPYEEINEEQYEELLAAMPDVDWDALGEYESEDNTVGSQTLSCASGLCAVVDLLSAAS